MTEDRVGAPPPPEPPDAPRPVSTPGWQRLVGGVLLGLVAVELAVLECFLVPLRVGTVPAPVAALVAVVGNVALTRAMYRVTLNRIATAVPVVCWLVIVLVLASRTSEGDLVVPGTWPGLLFLFAGTIAGAATLGRIVGPRRR